MYVSQPRCGLITREVYICDNRTPKDSRRALYVGGKLYSTRAYEKQKIWEQNRKKNCSQLRRKNCVHSPGDELSPPCTQEQAAAATTTTTTATTPFERMKLVSIHLRTSKQNRQNATYKAHPRTWVKDIQGSRYGTIYPSLTLFFQLSLSLSTAVETRSRYWTVRRKTLRFLVTVERRHNLLETSRHILYSEILQTSTRENQPHNKASNNASPPDRITEHLLRIMMPRPESKRYGYIFVSSKRRDEQVWHAILWSAEIKINSRKLWLANIISGISNSTEVANTCPTKEPLLAYGAKRKIPLYFFFLPGRAWIADNNERHATTLHSHQTPKKSTHKRRKDEEGKRLENRRNKTKGVHGVQFATTTNKCVCMHVCMYVCIM